MSFDQVTRIGERIREALDEATDAAEDIRTAREALLERVAVRNVTRSRRHGLDPVGHTGWRRIVTGFRGALLATGAVAVAAAVVIVWLRLPVTFRVGSADAPQGRLGDLVEASGAEPVAVWFSEGSSLILGTGGRVRVLSAEPTGARVLVESGAVDVAIVHRERRETRWRFEAGPFHVLVTGTKFRVGWKPEDQSFSLETREGAVVVSSACLPVARTVRGGESVALSCAPPFARDVRAGARVGGARVAESPSLSEALALLDEPAPTAQAAPARAIALADRPVGSSARAAQTGQTAVDWRDLIASGRYSDGLRAAERSGFAHACRTANEQELISLADAARLFGRTARAVDALGILRQRFPRSPGAATAAFALGRIAFERQGAYADAASWFATYLDEMPNGPLMGDAVGRLMEAHQRAGDLPRARADAESYLRRFPAGPYAAAAHAILTE